MYISVQKFHLFSELATCLLSHVSWRTIFEDCVQMIPDTTLQTMINIGAKVQCFDIHAYQCVFGCGVT